MGSTFLSEFMMISNINTVLFIVLLIGLFFVINKIKKSLNFTKLMLVSMGIGTILGFIIQYIAKFPKDPTQISWLKEVTTWYGLVGYGFMDLLKMLVIPLVLTSIIRVIMNMNKDENLGKLTSRTILMLLGTTAIAASIGLIVGNLFKLGIGTKVVTSTTEIREISSVVDTLRGLLPSNIVASMANANIVAVVIFAAFIGNAIKRLNKKYSELIRPFVDLIEASYKIIVSVSITIIKMMPYAVIALMANTIAQNGIESIFEVLNFIIALYVSVIIMFVVHLIIVTFNGVNPITYLKNVSKALLLAFTSRSSLATLPVTIEALTDNIGVESGTASFIGSLGSNMGLNGCSGIYPALMIVTIANMAGINMDFSFYAMALIVIIISSLGIAGLPGTATMAVSVVLSGLGLGSYFQLAGGILAIDPILDMGRTMLNVNGTMTSAITVANSLGKVCKNEFVEDIV